MLRLVALLSIVARSAAFGTFSAPGGSCIDEPAHAIAEVTATMGENYTQYTSCDVIAEAGGCVEPEAKVACCATCALPQRMTYAGCGSQDYCPDGYVQVGRRRGRGLADAVVPLDRLPREG